MRTLNLVRAQYLLGDMDLGGCMKDWVGDIGLWRGLKTCMGMLQLSREIGLGFVRWTYVWTSELCWDIYAHDDTDNMMTLTESA